MAQATPCQTPGATYHFIMRRSMAKAPHQLVGMQVSLPFYLDLDEDEAALIEAQLHNACEVILARYFPR